MIQWEEKYLPFLMMAIYDDVKITINLNELVEIRAKLISQYDDYSEKVNKGEYLDGGDIDKIAVKLRETLTWDALYYMIDDSSLTRSKFFLNSFSLSFRSFSIVSSMVSIVLSP